MSYQFKPPAVPNAKALDISQKKLDKILDFDKNFTGHEHPKRLCPNGGDASAFVGKMMDHAAAVKLGAEKGITYKEALKELPVQAGDGK